MRENDFALILGAIGAGLFVMSAQKKDLGEIVAEMGQSGDNAAALLTVIRQYESANNYAATYAYQFQITDFSDHPANKGWSGVTLPDNFCRAVNLAPGCVSTAAGAYQFIKPTWNRLKSMYALPDFSPASQDVAAFALLDEIGAIELVNGGDIEGALKKASTQWASMPFSKAGQPKQNLATVLDLYQSLGGTVA